MTILHRVETSIDAARCMRVLERDERELAADYALRVLEYNIQMLYMPPGSVIRETDVAERLHVSRTPVHEAVKVLSAADLVHVAPKRATFVSLIDMDAHAQGKFARIALEPRLIFELQGRLDEVQLAAFRDNIAAQHLAHQHRSTARDMIAIDDEFHRMLYTARGMDRVWDAVHQVAAQFDRVRYFGLVLGYERLMYDEHESMLNVLERGGTPLEEIQAMVESHLNGCNRFLGRLQEDHPEYFLGTADYDTSRSVEP